MADRLRIAVLLSGSGRSLQNLLDRSAANDLPGDVVLVISNRAEAFGLERARSVGIRAEVVLKKEHGGRFSQRIFDLCREARVDLVCMAGFLQLIHIPEDFAGRVLNIHPALLPDFGGAGMYGDRVHEAVLKAGVKETGCTVHVADNVYDNGPVLVQKRVPVLPGDTVHSLADRVFAAECEAYPEAIRLWAQMPRVDQGD
ncbi:MAG: phosphoribosylglycinamide formyltransferase [Gemmataceae bacterium]